MAENISYEYEKVEFGEEYSPNNTITEIAYIRKVDQNVLIKLNPYLLSTSIIRGGTVIKINEDGSKSETVPADAYSSAYTIQKFAVKHKVSAATLIELNKDTLSLNCCFDPNDEVLVKVGSMTSAENSFTPTTYIVEKDSITLEKIAKEKDIDIGKLKSLNPMIKDQTAVMDKQTIVLLSITASSGGTVEITAFGILNNTTRRLFLQWDWDTELNKDTSGYEIEWSYQNKVNNMLGNVSDILDAWIISGTDTTEKDVRQTVYNPPEEAVIVRVRVRPVAEGEGNENKYAWTTYEYHNFDVEEITNPGVPTVEIEGYQLTAFFENLNLDGTSVTYIDFQIVQDDIKELDIIRVPITEKIGYIACVYTIAAGHTYKVRCRSYSGQYNMYSSWSDYSSRGDAIPVAPVINEVKVISKTSINLTWTRVESADEYEIEYVKKDPLTFKNCTAEEYFRMSGVDIQTVTVKEDIENTNNTISHTILNIESGSEYFIRMRATNSTDVSKWSNIRSFILGSQPEAPTTWSSSSSVGVGDTLKLYWIHNSEDASIETLAEVILEVDGKVETITVPKSTDEDEINETSFYSVDTKKYPEGSKIKWKVRTAGVKTNDDNSPLYGPESMVREVDVYAPPSLSVIMKDSDRNTLTGSLTSLPLYIQLTAGNTNNQTPTGYYVSIISRKSYNTVDAVGNTKIVPAGSKVYSKYFDTSDTSLEVEISAEDVTLANNETYYVVCSVTMSSGLKAVREDIPYFTVAWNIKTYIPYADITIDKETLTASIRPYSNGKDNVLLSVYRREHNGSFTKLTDNITNGRLTYLVDPHPALDYARYRIIAKDKSTGAVSYNDMPGQPIKEKSVVIQWDEEWSTFDVINDSQKVKPAWSGSMLKIPYNIDVSNNHKQDASLVNYIGRKRPVSYYGTQLGETATWNMVIPKSDKETLYALRRLAIWMGDVYIREPSGSGYWANISINFSQRHLDLTIPITISVTPVEGGA